MVTFTKIKFLTYFKSYFQKKKKQRYLLYKLDLSNNYPKIQIFIGLVIIK